MFGLGGLLNLRQDDQSRRGRAESVNIGLMVRRSYAVYSHRDQLRLPGFD